MNENNRGNMLAALKPMIDLKVMDLVDEIGIDVGPWSLKKDGSAVANPRANPHYCYEWAFGGDNEPIGLCVWHALLVQGEQGIVYEGNMRTLAARLEEVAFDRSASSSTKSRAKSQAKRCDRFDQRVQVAFRKSLPVRIILLDGDMADDLGQDSSEVTSRSLDVLDWWVHAYDEVTGHFRLIRGLQLARRHELANEEQSPRAEKYVDQFSISAKRKERTVDAFVRSAEVRRLVLDRADGHCEYCGKRGFITAADEIYLETHHVIPLSEQGPDTVSNVVAICPDDHRRAHYAKEKAAIRNQLLARLAEKIATPANT